MNFKDMPEEAAWRQEVREFIRAQLPEDLRPGYGQPRGQRQDSGDAFARGASWREWNRRLAAKGWIAPAWPKEYGGAGMSVMEQFIFNEEMSEARAPRPGGIATGF